MNAELDDIIKSPDFKVLGWSLQDIYEVKTWLDQQNASIHDLKCASLWWHEEEKRIIMDILRQDFRT